MRCAERQLVLGLSGPIVGGEIDVNTVLGLLAFGHLDEHPMRTIRREIVQPDAGELVARLAVDGAVQQRSPKLGELNGVDASKVMA
jgi:hypothetical protein